MERSYEYNYEDIDACIRRANQLRSEAVGRMLVNGFAAGKNLLVRLVKHKDNVRCTITPPRSHELAC